VKAGQFVATLKLVPKEYSLALSSLQDKFLVTFKK
jgi:aarF domain-containing kinase